MFHLIDDEEQLLSLLQEIVESSGHKTQKFISAEQYLEYFNSPGYVAPIAIISDYSMDALTGLDLIRIVRKRLPLQKAIIASGLPSPKLDKSIHDHLCYLLHKPYQISELLKTIVALAHCEHERHSNQSFQIMCSSHLDHKCPFTTI